MPCLPEKAKPSIPALSRSQGFLTNQPKNYSPRPFLGVLPLERVVELFLLTVLLDRDGALFL